MVCIMTKEEQEKFFNDNINLAYKMANRYRINYIEEFEDIKQIALISLWRAVTSCDFSKVPRFSTYACTVILNNINYYLRGVRKHEKDISMCTPVNEQHTIEDILETEENDIDVLLDNLTCEEINSYILNQRIIRNPMHKKVYLIYLSGYMNQSELATKFNVTQSYISRIIITINEKLRKVYLEGEM